MSDLPGHDIRLDRDRDTIAAAKTQRRDSAPQSSLRQRIQQRRQDARAARADRMPKGHGAAVDIDLRGSTPS